MAISVIPYVPRSVCARTVTNTQETNGIHVDLLEYQIHPAQVIGIQNASADLGAFIAPCAVQSTEESHSMQEKDVPTSVWWGVLCVPLSSRIVSTNEGFLERHFNEFS